MFQTLADVPETFNVMSLLGSPDLGEANLLVVTKFLEALERGDDADTIKNFFTPDAIAVEFPNRLTPKGARRDLASLLEANARGRMVAPQQRYKWRSLIAVDHLVAVELEWIATVSIAIGSIPAGGEMRAQFAAFYEIRDGKIAAIRNYDCFPEF